MGYMDLTVCYPRKDVELNQLLTYGNMWKSWFGPHYEGEIIPQTKESCYNIMNHIIS